MHWPRTHACPPWRRRSRLLGLSSPPRPPRFAVFFVPRCYSHPHFTPGECRPWSPEFLGPVSPSPCMGPPLKSAVQCDVLAFSPGGRAPIAGSSQGMLLSVSYSWPLLRATRQIFFINVSRLSITGCHPYPTINIAVRRGEIDCGLVSAAGPLARTIFDERALRTAARGGTTRHLFSGSRRSSKAVKQVVMSSAQFAAVAATTTVVVSVVGVSSVPGAAPQLSRPLALRPC